MDLVEDWVYRSYGDNYVRVKGVRVDFTDGSLLSVVMWCIGNGFYKRDYIITIDDDLYAFN